MKNLLVGQAVQESAPGPEQVEQDGSQGAQTVKEALP
jgi:hypothetical protein